MVIIAWGSPKLYLASFTTFRVAIARVAPYSLPSEATPNASLKDCLDLAERTSSLFLSIIDTANPLLDTTGENCQEGDMGDIFFLVGTEGGSIERECTISEGQEILFPIINVVCFDKPGGLVSPGEFDPPKGPGNCQEQAESFIDQASNLEVTIDGVSIENLQEFRVLSYPFPIKLQEDNILGLPSGTYIGISDGYWVLVESLPEGEHTIHFAGQIGDFTVDVTYQLTVL